MIHYQLSTINHQIMDGKKTDTVSLHLLMPFTDNASGGFLTFFAKILPILGSKVYSARETDVFL
jgi:hypothetical protein